MGEDGDFGETTPNESSTEAEFLHHRSLFYLFLPRCEDDATFRVRLNHRSGADIADGPAETWALLMRLCAPHASHLNNNKPDSVDCDTTTVPGDG